jgi:hypothetical protein
VVVDSAGSAYVAGSTSAVDFPTIAGGFQTVSHGTTNAFVAKLTADRSGLLYSTYLGGSGSPLGDGANFIAIDSSDNAYATGINGSSDFPTNPLPSGVTLVTNASLAPPPEVT